MATALKSVANMTKHLTSEEIAARSEAEARYMPVRQVKRSALIKLDKPAAKHWARIMKDMKGLDILDVLDSDALGIYCAKLARRDDLQARYLDLRTAYEQEPDANTLKMMLKISAELQSGEAQLLAYASRLGLTPESRLRMARRAAEPVEDDPNADLFG